MCVICQISLETALSLGLMYQPTPADQEKILMMNQRIERIIQQPSRSKVLESKLDQWIVSLPPQSASTYIPLIAKQLVEYNKTIY